LLLPNLEDKVVLEGKGKCNNLTMIAMIKEEKNCCLCPEIEENFFSCQVHRSTWLRSSEVISGGATSVLGLCQMLEFES